MGSPMIDRMLAAGIPVAQPQGLKLDGKYAADAAAAREALQAAEADVMVVAAYGLILPQWVLDTPTRGCLNIHASRLPRWRGAAPIQAAIRDGRAETGVSIMRMVPALDAGPVILALPVEIMPDETAGELQLRLAEVGAEGIVEALAMLDIGGAPEQPQDDALVTYAKKIDRAGAECKAEFLKK